MLVNALLTLSTGPYPTSKATGKLPAPGYPYQRMKGEDVRSGRLYRRPLHESRRLAHLNWPVST